MKKIELIAYVEEIRVRKDRTSVTLHFADLDMDKRKKLQELNGVGRRKCLEVTIKKVCDL
ncbi:MAG: hypothetical protein V3W44_09985 [Dehalococcoidales bacterium]